MKYRLAIFDMDGTILDTLEDLTDSVNVTLKAFSMKERTIDEVRGFVGNGIRKLIERAAKEGTDAEKIDEMFRFFTTYYKDHNAIKTKPYEGIVEVIRALKDRGYLTAVVSNKADFAVKDLCKDYFDGLFDAALGDLEGRRRKPYPDSVNQVLDELRVERKDAVYIGDSEVDLETAKNACMDVIPVTWGFREEAFLQSLGATGFARSPKELLNIL